MHDSISMAEIRTDVYMSKTAMTSREYWVIFKTETNFCVVYKEKGRTGFVQMFTLDDTADLRGSIAATRKFLV